MNALLIDPGRKVLRHPARLADMRSGGTVWPLHVEFDLTNRCNARCTWCDFAYMHDGAVMPTDLACRILAELKDAGVEAVTFTGGGEPTVHPDFADIARVARVLGLHLGLYTNLLDIRGLRDVVECFDWIYPSLDSTSREEYRRVKGVDGYERATAHIREIVDRRIKGQTAVGLGFLLTGDSYARVGLAHMRAAEFGVDYVQFRPVVGLLTYTWIREALGYLRLSENAGGVPVYYSPSRFLEMADFSRSYSLCRGSALVPCVGADGTLWACVNTRGLRSLGSLAHESFRDLWLRRPAQYVGADCRASCRNHALNETLEYVCSGGPHDAFV